MITQVKRKYSMTILLTFQFIQFDVPTAFVIFQDLDDDDE